MRSEGTDKRELFCESAPPEELCREAIRYLDASFRLPPDKLEGEVDEAERRVVKLRDCLIEHLREDLKTSGQSRWRKPLDQVNIAITFLVGVEYPATGVLRKYLESAKEVLEGVQGELSG